MPERLRVQSAAFYPQLTAAASASTIEPSSEQ